MTNVKQHKLAFPVHACVQTWLNITLGRTKRDLSDWCTEVYWEIVQI